jgi:hypothetical protein
VLFASLILIGVAGCSAPSAATSGTAVPTAPAVPTSATQPNVGFHLTQPAGWVSQPADTQHQIAAIFTAPESDPAEKKAFRANINITITPNNENLAETVAQTEQEYPNYLPNYRSVSDEPATLASGRAARLIGGTYDSADSGSLRNLQLLVENADNLYVVTATTTATSFDRYEGIIRSSLLTFTLT